MKKFSGTAYIVKDTILKNYKILSPLFPPVYIKAEKIDINNNGQIILYIGSKIIAVFPKIATVTEEQNI